MIPQKGIDRSIARTPGWRVDYDRLAGRETGGKIR
jgi:hypothetical protein